MLARKRVYSHMTRSTQCNEIRFNVVKGISVYMMDIRSRFNGTNRARTRSSAAHLFKESNSILKRRRVLTNAKFGMAFFRAKLPLPNIFGSLVAVKRFSARFTTRVILRSFEFSMTFFRTIELGAMFKSGFKKLKVFTAINTISRYSRYSKPFIRTQFTTKTFFLIFNSVCSHLKGFVTDTANKVNPVASKFMLTYGRAEEVLMPFYFVGECIKRFVAKRTVCFHGYKDIRWTHCTQAK